MALPDSSTPCNPGNKSDAAGPKASPDGARQKQRGVGSLLDGPAVATFDPPAVLGENPAIVRVTIKPLHDHARLPYIDRSCGPMMAGKALQVEKTSKEVERHIDRTHGVPAILAAMGGDHCIEQLAHLNVSLFPRGRPSQPPSVDAKPPHSDEPRRRRTSA